MHEKLMGGVGLWCLSYIMAVSFIGEGNRSTQRQTLSHKVVSSTPHHE